MENLRDTYRDDDDDDDDDEEWSNGHHDGTAQTQKENPKPEPEEEEEEDDEEVDDDEEEEEEDDDERVSSAITDKLPLSKHPIIPSTELSDEDEDTTTNTNSRKKQKPLACFTAAPAPLLPTETPPPPTTVSLKKPPKKKPINVWTKSTSRKGKKLKKNSKSVATGNEDAVLVTPIPRFPDRTDDSVDMKICLSKVYKAEKVELSEDRLMAGSSKGYRMVRATRGVLEGAWFFEIKVSKLGDTGHTRLGWSTEKGDLQAPVGYDGNSFGYRDVDGSKIHKALREKYAEEGYVEGDVIGCYINLPEGSLYAPKPPQLVWHKGQRYVYAADGKEDPPKVVPGSEISFFKNGTCQGVAFKDLYGGRYYPAASMYTLPNQPNCVVKFNFGPDFDLFPEEFDGRPIPRPMIEVPYHGFDNRFDGLPENGLSSEKKN